MDTVVAGACAGTMPNTGKELPGVRSAASLRAMTRAVDDALRDGLGLVARA